MKRYKIVKDKVLELSPDWWGVFYRRSHHKTLFYNLASLRFYFSNFLLSEVAEQI